MRDRKYSKKQKRKRKKKKVFEIIREKNYFPFLVLLLFFFFLVLNNQLKLTIATTANKSMCQNPTIASSEDNTTRTMSPNDCITTNTNYSHSHHNEDRNLTNDNCPHIKYFIELCIAALHLR